MGFPTQQYQDINLIEKMELEVVYYADKTDLKSIQKNLQRE